MTINTYLFVNSFIDLNTSKKNFYLRVIVKVSAFCIHNLIEMQCSLMEKSTFESDLGTPWFFFGTTGSGCLS